MSGATNYTGQVRIVFTDDAKKYLNKYWKINVILMFVIPLVVFALDYLLFYWFSVSDMHKNLIKHGEIVAEVGDYYITREEAEEWLAGQAGLVTPTQDLIVQHLLEERLKDANAQITDEQIENRLKEMLQLNGVTQEQWDSLMNERGASYDVLKRLIWMDLAQEALIGDVTISDQDVDDFISNQKDAGMDESQLQNREAIRKYLENGEKSQKIQELQNELLSDPSITYYIGNNAVTIDNNDSVYHLGNGFNSLYNMLLNR